MIITVNIIIYDFYHHVLKRGAMLQKYYVCGPRLKKMGQGENATMRSKCRH